jgi:hypothetical protein
MTKMMKIFRFFKTMFRAMVDSYMVHRVQY